MASSNMFAVLSDHESDDEFTSVKQQKSNNEGKSRAEKRQRKPQDNSTSQSGKNAIGKTPVESKNQTSHNSKKHPRDQQKQKGVSSQPHPKDRQSGNGMGREQKRDGAGKGTWGNYKDDMKQDRTENNEGEQTEEFVQEEDVSLTLEEYMASKNKRQQQEEENQVQRKKDLDLTSFKKEGCELVEQKNKREFEVTKVSKHNKNSAKYNLAMNSENSDLLGFRTGLQTYTLKERTERTERPEREERKPRDEPKKEETTEQQEGENAEEQEKPEREQKSHRGNRRGGRGGRGGRNNGDRKSYGQRGERKQEPKVITANLEDDSSFPKLG